MMRCKFSKTPLFARGFKHSKSAVKYAQDVVKGKIPVCEWVRLSCSRFLDELEQSKNPDYPYMWDKIEVERVCCFAESQVHVKGKWASAPKQERFFRTEPWEKFLLGNIFGWKKKADGYRRFREIYVEVPRKNGKSFICAVIGLYMFACDHEAGSEVYCSATSRDQAYKVFEPAKLMVKANQPFRDRYRINVKEQSLRLNDGSVFEPIIATPKDGASPHCSILDEFHEHSTDALYASQATGQGARTQPLLVVITTAGKDITSPCHELHERAIKNLQDYTELHDDSFFCVIYTIDKEDDPYTIESLIKANPNYGVSIDLDFIKRQLLNAQKNVKLRTDFLTKHLDIWVSQKEAYFDILAWQELQNKSLNIADFVDCECFIAVDMSAKYDLTVITTCFIRREPDNLKHLYVFQDTYLPEGTVYDTDCPNYKRYQSYMNMDSPNTLSGKLLTVTPGSEVDTDVILMEIETKINTYTKLQEVIFDPWEARPIINSLAKKYPRLTILEMQQTTKNLSPGMKELTGAIMSKRIHHDGNEILTWNMQNVESKTDKNENEFPTNANPKVNKKDGAVTLIMCATRCEQYDPKVNMSELILKGGGFRTF